MGLTSAQRRMAVCMIGRADRRSAPVTASRGNAANGAGGRTVVLASASCPGTAGLPPR